MTLLETSETGAGLALAELDARLGLFTVGELSVGRSVLAQMGAQVAGTPIAATQLAGREADQTLIDSISFAAPELKRFLGADGTLSDPSASLLFEFASLRSASVAPLLRLEPGTALEGTMKKLDDLLCKVQRTNLDQAAQLEGLPAWVDMPKSSALAVMGTGLQLYGYFSAIQALGQAIKAGDITQTVVAGAELLGELTSTALEAALEALGKRMMEQGGLVFKSFSASTVGQLLRRGAGLFALILTLPFDIASAVKSLQQAAQTSGKEALDHYVSAGFSVASATLGIVLGIAALAGFSYAGPLGVAAAVVLIIGAQIYSAVRQVDDIDDYIELSFVERLRAGWLSFEGKELDQDVRDRYRVARLQKQHADHLQSQARRWLDGALKSTLSAVVNGKFEVRLRAARHWKYAWDASAGDQPYVDTHEPVIVDTDDVIDASQCALDQLPGVVIGAAGASSSLLWRLGGGNDDVKGCLSTPNIFQFGTGHKQLRGGDLDDQFVCELPPGMLEAPAAGGQASALQGGEGSDTLLLSNHASYDEGALGCAIDLEAGTLSRRKDGVSLMTLDSIENVSTPAGLASQVKGSAQANILIGAGNQDRIEAGGGDDTVIVQGTDVWVDGGAGKDLYVIAGNRGTVTLHEQDWQEECLIEMRWELAAIARWYVAECALVVVSLRGVEGELPERVIRIEQLYERIDGQRRLKPNRLRFTTADGYTLAPILEPLLSAQGEQPVTVAAYSANQAACMDRVLNAGEFRVPSGRFSQCFIERGMLEKVVKVGLKGDTTACALYLDYTASELLDVVAGYRATLRKVGEFDSLTYSDVTLTFHWVDGARLVLRDYASDRSTVRTLVASNLKAVSLKLDCRFMLVMRDGVSYRVLPMQQAYLQDRAAPGMKAFDGRSALSLRAGRYPFLRPPCAKGVWLQSVAQKIVIPAPPHRQTYALMGRGAVYEVWPSAGSTIALSTPGALAKTSDASSWQIHTEGLNELIGPEHIILTSQALRVGSVTLRLAQVSDVQVPLEHISVHTLEGDRYDIRLDLGTVFLAQLDASRYETVELVWDALRRYRQHAAVRVRRLRVVGVELADGSASTIYYDAVNDQWGADGEPTRSVTSAQLRRTGTQNR